MNSLSWLFLWEGTSLGYYLNEMFLKILVIVYMFLLRGNHVFVLLETVHLNDNALSLQIPAGDIIVMVLRSL